MAGDVVKAEHVNPFIISVCKIMKDMCMLDLKIGKPGIKKRWLFSRQLTY